MKNGEFKTMRLSYRNNQAKILSTMFVFLLISTTIFPVVSSLEIEQDTDDSIIGKLRENISIDELDNLRFTNHTTQVKPRINPNPLTLTFKGNLDLSNMPKR